MLLRDRIIELAVRSRELAARPPLDPERQEVAAELDAAILAAGSPPDALTVDEAILSILGSEPHREAPLHSVIGEIADWVERSAVLRLSELEARGLVQRTESGGFRVAGPASTDHSEAIAPEPGASC